MSSTFVTAYNKLLDKAEPRFIGLGGNECGLKRLIVEVLKDRDYEFNEISGQDFVPDYAHLVSYRPSKSRLVYIPDAGTITDWTWLPTWFAKTKTIKLVVAYDDYKLNKKLTNIVKTKGWLISCKAPSGALAQKYMVTTLAHVYGFDEHKTRHALEAFGWHISECMNYFDKLSILSLHPSIDTLTYFGVELKSKTKFMNAMYARNKADALEALQSLDSEQYLDIAQSLSKWLARLARLKSVYSPFGDVEEIALASGETVKGVHQLKASVSKFDNDTINKDVMLIGAIITSLQQKPHISMLESLVNLW